jgi:hypothetical protein
LDSAVFFRSAGRADLRDSDAFASDTGSRSAKRTSDVYSDGKGSKLGWKEVLGSKHLSGVHALSDTLIAFGNSNTTDTNGELLKVTRTRGRYNV